MTTRTAEISAITEIPRIVKHVRVVGFLLLLLIPLAIFGQIYVPPCLSCQQMPQQQPEISWLLNRSSALVL